VEVAEAHWRDSLGLLRQDAPLVASQLLLLASTTLGTVVVGQLANADTTAAYAATEKLFNLGATVLVGLYMALYPRLASLFYADRGVYWQKIKLILLVCVAGGLAGSTSSVREACADWLVFAFAYGFAGVACFAAFCAVAWLVHQPACANELFGLGRAAPHGAVG
jgi:hypothetical protein